jgi:MtN3 and saliva related transmembrane protein
LFCFDRNDKVRRRSTFAAGNQYLPSSEGFSFLQRGLQAARHDRGRNLTLLTTIIGLSAAICTTSAFLPQVIKAWRSRSTHDISAGMFVLQTTGNALWLIYGLLIVDLPLVAANAITLGLSGTVLALKLRYG